jgi:invasion protein IalB
MNTKTKIVLGFLISGLPFLATSLIPPATRPRAAAPPVTGPLADKLEQTVWPSAVIPPPQDNRMRISTRRFGAWDYRCRAPASGQPGQPVCQLVEDVLVRQDGKIRPIMSIAFGASIDGQGLAVIARLPLGIRPVPVGLTSNYGTAQTIAFDFCGPHACWANGAVDRSLLAALELGKTGQAKLIMSDGRPLTIEFPLAGFNAGMAALDSGPDAPDTK